MKPSLRNLVLLSAALCSSAAFAAQQRRVEVPFNFVAKNHTYKAGAYTVTMNTQQSMVTLSEVGRPSQPLTWIVGPGDSGSKVSLTFDVTASDHVLRTIRYQSFTTPNLDTKPKHRVESIATIGE